MALTTQRLALGLRSDTFSGSSAGGGAGGHPGSRWRAWSYTQNASARWPPWLPPPDPHWLPVQTLVGKTCAPDFPRFSLAKGSDGTETHAVKEETTVISGKFTLPSKETFLSHQSSGLV